MKRGRFTPEDKQRARDWPSCAVGERVPGVTSEMSRDDVVARFLDSEEALTEGGTFYGDVNGDDVREARTTYRRIRRLKLTKAAHR